MQISMEALIKYLKLFTERYNILKEKPILLLSFVKAYLACF